MDEDSPVQYPSTMNEESPARYPLAMSDEEVPVRYPPMKQRTKTVGYTYSYSGSYNLNKPIDEFILPNNDLRLMAPSLNESFDSHSTRSNWDDEEEVKKKPHKAFPWKSLLFGLLSSSLLFWLLFGPPTPRSSHSSSFINPDVKQITHFAPEENIDDKIMRLINEKKAEWKSEIMDAIDDFTRSNETGLITSEARSHDDVEVFKQSIKDQINQLQVEKAEMQAAIFEAIRKFRNDKTGEPDFALESAGGSVLQASHTYGLLPRRESFLGIPLWFTAYSPRSVIQRPSQSVIAGECWPVAGSESYIIIKLARRIKVTAVSYEHLPREMSLNGEMDSAPKDFRIYSMESEHEPIKFLIGEYTFDDQGEPLQRFEAQRHDPRGTSIIEFQVNSNYGAAYTCLYRLRVHGILV